MCVCLVAWYIAAARVCVFVCCRMRADGVAKYFRCDMSNVQTNWLFSCSFHLRFTRRWDALENLVNISPPMESVCWCGATIHNVCAVSIGSIGLRCRHRPAKYSTLTAPNWMRVRGPLGCVCTCKLHEVYIHQHFYSIQRGREKERANKKPKL